MALNLTAEQLEFAIAKQRCGWTQERIAKELGIHRQSINRALSRHNRRAMARLEKRTAAEKGRQIAQLEWAIEQAGEVFSRTNDPALLGQFRGALADIRKIAGLDAPEKKAPGDDRPQHDLGSVAAMVVEMVERMSGRADSGSES